MGSTNFLVSVSYSQLAVFHAALEHPFNDWTDRHVNQGFAWRPESVSFRTVAEAGPHRVEVFVSVEETQPSPDAIRIIEVPFEVPPDGAVEIASIADGASVKLSPGMHSLRFEGFGAERGSETRVRLVFRRNDQARFSVIRADGDLSIEGELLTTASPA